MTVQEIAANPADALAARLDRARAALANLDENGEKWAMLDGKLYVEASNGVDCWTTDGVSCDCPDATIGTGAQYLKGMCTHAALKWLIDHQHTVRRADELTDRDTALLAKPVSIDPLFKMEAPRKARKPFDFDLAFPV